MFLYLQNYVPLYSYSRVLHPIIFHAYLSFFFAALTYNALFSIGFLCYSLLVLLLFFMFILFFLLFFSFMLDIDGFISSSFYFLFDIVYFFFTLYFFF